jgi:pilus assembly protein CpaB
MNRHAFFLALVLSVSGALLLLLYMRQFEREMSGGESVLLLMAVKPIERGAIVTDEMLTTRAVPIAYVEDRAVKAAERAKVVGLQASTSLGAQQTLLWTDLAITTEERDLSALVQPGRRGFTVRAMAGSDDTRGNALIRPGDYVDVIVTMTNEQSATAEQTSVVLLQRVLVLAVGTDTGSNERVGADGKRTDSGFQSERVLTLSLNLQESQLLALALEKGRLSVAVRNPDDQRVLGDVPDMRSAALLDTAARRDVQRREPRPPSNQPVKIEGP